MTQAPMNANRGEFLRIADAVAREKFIDRAVVLTAMENAIQRAAILRYGSENEIRVRIDPKTGDVKLERLLEVVEHVEDISRQVSLSAARRDRADAEIGDVMSEELPAFDLGRVAAQSAKHVIVQQVREAERTRQYEEYKDRKGQIVNGTVKRVEHGDVMVDLGQAEAIIRSGDGLPRESFGYGDRIRAYIQDVKQDGRGPQIFLSRTHPQFMVSLFSQEVPEIYDGIVQVKAVSRDPGSRAKIAVVSKDPSIDPVGACVGMRGSRVQAVVNELQGEKVDIIPWSEDPATFIVNALAPAEVVKVVLDEMIRRIEVVVPNDQLSRAIGRRGQNVRLASQLTGWDIDILTEAEESERRQKEFTERTEIFVSVLDVDEMIGQLLASEGFASVRELAEVSREEIESIEGLDEETAEEIQNRAREYLVREDEALAEEYRGLGVDEELLSFGGLTGAMLVALGKGGVKTMEDLAGCVPDDLVGWTEVRGQEKVRHEGLLKSFEFKRDRVTALIMEARVRAGWIERKEDEEGVSGEGEDDRGIEV